MNRKGQNINCNGDTDQAYNSRYPVADVGLHRHLQISQHVPQILNGVQSNESYNKETDPFDARYTAE